MKKFRNIFAAAALAAAGLAAVAWGRQQKTAGVPFATPYQAVLLSNGSVYFGQLEGYGTAMPVLKNAFYVVTRNDPDKKSVSNVLVKRGGELHSPDRMYLNPGAIVFVETVGADSKVAHLITEAR